MVKNVASSDIESVVCSPKSVVVPVLEFALSRSTSNYGQQTTDFRLTRSDPVVCFLFIDKHPHLNITVSFFLRLHFEFLHGVFGEQIITKNNGVNFNGAVGEETIIPYFCKPPLGFFIQLTKILCI